MTSREEAIENKREAIAGIRQELQRFANWWASYTTDEHYTGNSYCLEVMQKKTDECVTTILSLSPIPDELPVISDERLEVEVADKLAEYFKDPVDDPCCYCKAAKAVIPIIQKAERERIYAWGGEICHAHYDRVLKLGGQVRRCCYKCWQALKGEGDD